MAFHLASTILYCARLHCPLSFRCHISLWLPVVWQPRLPCRFSSVAIRLYLSLVSAPVCLANFDQYYAQQMKHYHYWLRHGALESRLGIGFTTSTATTSVNAAATVSWLIDNYSLISTPKVLVSSSTEPVNRYANSWALWTDSCVLNVNTMASLYCYLWLNCLISATGNTWNFDGFCSILHLTECKAILCNTLT